MLDENGRIVKELRSLCDLVQSQPQTEQTAHDLRAIRESLRLAEAELKAGMDKTARTRR